MTLRPLLAVGLGAIALAACSKPANQASAPAPGDQPMASSGVDRQAIAAPTATPTTAAAPAAIQTQPGPQGFSVALNKAAVTGDILTVALTYSGGSCCAYVPIDEVSVIDDATSKRIGVLKDNAAAWIASPLDSDGKRVRIGFMSGSKPVQVWFKFPAPPPTSKTVSITIPEVAPFDAVPVTR